MNMQNYSYYDFDEDENEQYSTAEKDGYVGDDDDDALDNAPFIFDDEETEEEYD